MSKELLDLINEFSGFIIKLFIPILIPAIIIGVIGFFYHKKVIRGFLLITAAASFLELLIWWLPKNEIVQRIEIGNNIVKWMTIQNYVDLFLLSESNKLAEWTNIPIFIIAIGLFIIIEKASE